MYLHSVRIIFLFNFASFKHLNFHLNGSILKIVKVICYYPQMFLAIINVYAIAFIFSEFLFILYFYDTTADVPLLPPFAHLRLAPTPFTMAITTTFFVSMGYTNMFFVFFS